MDAKVDLNGMKKNYNTQGAREIIGILVSLVGRQEPLRPNLPRWPEAIYRFPPSDKHCRARFGSIRSAQIFRSTFITDDFPLSAKRSGQKVPHQPLVL